VGEHGVVERLLQPESNLNLRHTSPRYIESCGCADTIAAGFAQVTVRKAE
jgi:hypothetical protein